MILKPGDAAYFQCLIIAAPFGVQSVARRDAEDLLVGTDERLFRQDFSQELDDAALFIGPQIIRFVEDEEDLRRLRFQGPQIFELASVIGGSAEMTKNAASHSGITRQAASVLCRSVEPTPGVSTITVPSARISAG